MDKNTIIGFLLIGIILFGFTWLNRPSEEQMAAQRHYQDSIAHVAKVQQAAMENQAAAVPTDSASILNNPTEAPDSLKAAFLQNNYGVFAGAAEGTEEFATLENSKIKVKLGTKGGKVYAAEVKNYKTYDSKPLILFDGDDSYFNLALVTASNKVVNTSDLYFTLLKGTDANTVTMRLNVGETGHLDFVYTLAPDDYRLRYTISGSGLNGLLSPSTSSLEILWTQEMRQLEKGRKYEDQYTGLYYKLASDDVEHLNEAKNDGKELSQPVKWIGFKNKYFASVLIAENPFTTTTLDSKLLTDSTYLKKFSATSKIPFNISGENSISFTYFFGPNKFKLLNSYDKGLSSSKSLDLEELVPMGYKWVRPINKYFILPIFDFLSQHIANYGLIIFLLTLIVKFCLFPLTYKSYISSAKMRVLRPEVEEINAKYPNQEQAMEKQKEVMDLYNRAGASPMAGCLPMLLQMPILIALYWLFPTTIELRQQGFLWAEDLSTFDAIISWNTNIPFLSTFYGNHVSLFCLLMTIVNLIYTKYNMSLTDTGQQQMPGMKVMMYIMPLMFLFLFNQNSAGLSYYFLVSTLITIIQTMIFRFSINEEKLLAKLQENKKKPQKKSAFMKRLEEAQKLQEERMRQQNKGKK